MTQLLCNGEFLDLPPDTNMTFQKVNPLFAFDDLSCERTTSFKLPATAKNDRILSLAKDPAFRGDGMRKRFDAQLHNGLCVKNGFLYVDLFNGSYSAIFVTGELVGLKSIKDMGKLSDIITTSLVCEYGGNAIDASTASSNTWGNVKYRLERGNLLPSMRVKDVVQLAAEQNDLPTITLPSAVENLRLIPAKLNGLKKQAVQLASSISGQYDTDEHYNSVSSNHMELFTEQDGAAFCTLMNVSRQAIVRHFVPYQEIKISFPEGFPDNIHIVNFDENGVHTFLGDWDFMKTWDATARKEVVTHTSGQSPLQGRVVTIPSGKPFIFVSEDDYMNRKVQGVGGSSYTDIGWWFNGGGLGLVFDYSLEVAGGNVSLHDKFRLQDNLPEQTLTDMLKAVAALCGRVLNYTDAEGLTFNELDIDSWQPIDLTGKQTAAGNLKRSFGKYGQKNVVKFDHDDWVLDELVRTYTIENANITEEYALTTIPFNEGNGFADIYVDGNADGSRMTICDEGSSTHLHRCSLPLNSGIQRLCDASTSYVAKFNLSQFEFEKIKPECKILLNGTLYVWTEATWSKDTAEFTLAKV